MHTIIYEHLKKHNELVLFSFDVGADFCIQLFVSQKRQLELKQ